MVCVGTLSSFSFRHERTISSFTLIVPTVRYGLELERFADYEVTTITDSTTTVADLLEGVGMKRKVARALEEQAHARSVYTSLAGRRVASFLDRNGEPLHLAIELNDHEFARVEPGAKRLTILNRDEVQAEYRDLALYFQDDLEATLARAELAPELSEQVRRALGRDLPLDTRFTSGIVQLIYPIKLDEAGSILGYGNIEAIRYRVDGEQRDAIRFTDDSLDVEGFFRPDGTPAQPTFLLNPAPGSWISSSYDLKRRHPVLKYVKPHYGTDFAAAYGTPIISVSDGVVIARDQTRTNGNYVKIRHDGTYQSQYLHMKDFAHGIRVGSKVKKGQVIGYVGSTGLSSGPHVCFRFWRNGRQINHMRAHLPTGNHLSDKALSAFTAKQEQLTAFLDGV